MVHACVSSLAESRRRVESVEAQRRDLIVAVSHDLRTPLSDLRVMAEAIEDGVVEDPETVTFYTDRILASVKSLSTLVDDLFEFAKLDAGEIERETERAELSEIVGQALAACQAHASDKGLVVRTELGDAAEWDCSPRVTRVVQNLLQNAIRHTPADGTVLVVARTSDAGIELRVEDTGEGVQAEPLERVFEPFWRGDSARTSDGSGLGLAVAKRIVEALGGSISVESQVSLGTRFSVVLPPAP
jgi:signal transduction histidine kinase